MEIWLDAIDTKAITRACRLGFIHGITTNPSLLAGANADHERTIQSILDVQDGPVAVQIMAEESEEMIKRAHALRVFSDRIIVKIPATQNGYIAINTLAEDGVPTMATTIFHPNQAFLAAMSNAQYVAPYVGRMFDAGVDAYAALRSIAKVYKQSAFETKILAAALKTPEQILACAEMGIDAMTIKSSLFSEFIADNEDTLESLKAFAEAWEAHDYSKSSSLLL